MVFGFEFIIAQAIGHPRPEQRFAANHPHTHPVVWFFGIVREGDFTFVHPLIRIEFVSLKQMWQLARFAEAAIGQFVHGFERALPREIHQRPRFEHQAFCAFLRQDVRRHTARCARANDEYVVFDVGHDLPEKFSTQRNKEAKDQRAIELEIYSLSLCLFVPLR